MLVRYDPASPAAQTLLVVCTANVCRSPLVQGLLQQRLAGLGWLGEIELASAGTQAEPGVPMCEVSGERLGDAGFQAAHASQPLTRQAIQQADLVLTMEREQRGEVARTAPGSQSKVFTLREADALADAAARRVEAGEIAPAGDLKRLAQVLHSTRGTVPIPAPKRARAHWWQRRGEPADPLTIEDGHGGTPQEHRARIDEAADIAGSLAARLAVVSGRPHAATGEAPDAPRSRQPTG